MARAEVMIDIGEQMIGMWFVSLPVGDWLCGVWRDDKDRVRAAYRFRYYDVNRPGSPWDNDKKNWYGIATNEKETDAVVVSKFNAIANELAASAKSEVNDFVDMRGLKTVSERAGLLLKYHWCQLEQFEIERKS